MKEFTGTGKLVRLILRRDRFILPIWIALLAVIPASLVTAVAGLYSTAAERARYVTITNSNPALLANYGKIYGTSLGAVSAQRAGTLPLVVAIISLLMVIRHTRTDEEAGRRELVGSTVVGRQASLAAALVATVGADVVLGTLVAAAMAAQNLPVTGSIALGLAYAATGVFGAALGGLVAQLTQGAGGARGTGISVLGLTLVLRGVGDASQPGGGNIAWLSWLSPLHWAHEIRSYAHEQWWVLGLFAAVFVVLTAAAVALNARRDMGAGVLPARLGRATAPATLSSPLGLAWRLHRVLLVGWVAGFAVYGLFLGAIAGTVNSLYAASPQLGQFIARLGERGQIVDQFFALMLAVLGMVVSGYAIQAALRMRREEAESRAEPVLATAVSRWGWAASHLTFALAGPAISLAVCAALGGLVYGATIGEPGRQVWRLLGAALVQLPAVLVLAGIAVALFGLAPRLTALAWAAFAAALTLGLVGPLVKLPRWMLDISPFTHVPKLPGGEFALAPVAWLTAIAAALIAAGMIGFRRRDVTSG